MPSLKIEKILLCAKAQEGISYTMPQQHWQLTSAEMRELILALNDMPNIKELIIDRADDDISMGVEETLGKNKTLSMLRLKYNCLSFRNYIRAFQGHLSNRNVYIALRTYYVGDINVIALGVVSPMVGVSLALIKKDQPAENTNLINTETDFIPHLMPDAQLELLEPELLTIGCIRHGEREEHEALIERLKVNFEKQILSATAVRPKPIIFRPSSDQKAFNHLHTRVTNYCRVDIKGDGCRLM